MAVEGAGVAATGVEVAGAEGAAAGALIVVVVVVL